MAKQYKTMRGKPVNMDALRIKHEESIALGNMGVNARGDSLGPGGKVVKDRGQRVREENRLHTMIPNKVKVSANKEASDKKATEAKNKEVEKQLADKILSDADIPVVDSDKKPKGGLAASIAEEDEK